MESKQPGRERLARRVKEVDNAPKVSRQVTVRLGAVGIIEPSVAMRLVNGGRGGSGAGEDNQVRAVMAPSAECWWEAGGKASVGGEACMREPSRRSWSHWLMRGRLVADGVKHTRAGKSGRGRKGIRARYGWQSQWLRSERSWKPAEARWDTVRGGWGKGESLAACQILIFAWRR